MVELNWHMHEVTRLRISIDLFHGRHLAQQNCNISWYFVPFQCPCQKCHRVNMGNSLLIDQPKQHTMSKLYFKFSCHDMSKCLLLQCKFFHSVRSNKTSRCQSVIVCTRHLIRFKRKHTPLVKYGSKAIKKIFEIISKAMSSFVFLRWCGSYQHTSRNITISGFVLGLGWNEHDFLAVVTVLTATAVGLFPKNSCVYFCLCFFFFYCVQTTAFSPCVQHVPARNLWIYSPKKHMTLR